MKNKILLCMVMGCTYQAHAAMIDLTGAGYVTYGDFNTYSLPIDQLEQGCSGPGCPLYVNSTPGQISDLIVVATGASGVPVNTNFAGMDNAYATPSGESGSNFFSTSTTADADQVSDFFGDQSNTWDSSLLALKTFLAGDQMVMFFNNNNLNGGNLQSLAAWAQIEITDNNGDRVAIYDFTNNNNPYALVTEGGGGQYLGDPTAYTSTGAGPIIGDNNATDYVLSGGPICIDYDLNPGLLTPVSCDSPAADYGPINHNLGANEAAYAVAAPELNAVLSGLFGLDDATLANYTMHIDLRLGCDPLFGTATDEICTGVTSGYGKNINNGYEQLFIGTATFDQPPPPRIPEPQMLMLFALGLLSLGVSRFRKVAA